MPKRIRKQAGNEAKLRMAAMTVVDDNGKKFPIEISKHEYVDEKVREIVDDFAVYAYSPQMLVAEKLRAICQQMPEYTSYLRKHATPRGRDFLDIHTVAEYFKVEFGSPVFTKPRKECLQRNALTCGCYPRSQTTQQGNSTGLILSRSRRRFARASNYKSSTSTTTMWSTNADC